MDCMEDVGAETQIVSEDLDTEVGGSGSKSKGNGGRVSEIGENEGDGSASVGETVVAAETVVESTCEDNSVLGCVLGDNNEKKKVRVENADVFEGNTNDSKDTTDVKDGFNGVDRMGKDCPNYCSDEGKGRFEDSGVENGNEEDGMNVDGDELGEKDDEKPEGDWDTKFCVGDLVWGKIRSHPWWPGQVYDPNDASEYALKSKVKGRLLVAFFGDGSWSWCLPSQLVPFVENFASMSRKSSAKNFLNAIQSAVGEVGRLVESQMVCNCVAKEKKDSLARPVVENAGVKAGVIMPQVAEGRLSIHKHESKELVGKVRQFAKTVCSGNAIDLAVMRSCLSAFYYFKGGYKLASYPEPLLVEGLEDKSDNGDKIASDFGVPVEVPIKGPKDDEWQYSPTAGVVGSPGLSGDKIYHKRKRKSVAEIMEESKSTMKKCTSSRKRKTNNAGGEEEPCNEGASSIGKTGKRHKGGVSESSKTTKERYSSAGKNGVEKGLSSKKFMNTKVEDIVITSNDAKEEPEMLSSPRERKKSKYLSPPYTTPTWRTGISSSRTDSEMDHDKSAQAGCRTPMHAGERAAHKPVSESADEISEEKLSNSDLSESDDEITEEKPPNSELENSDISLDDKNMNSTSDAYASVSQLVSKVKHAALDPFYLSEEGSLDMVWAFVYALRGSTYLHGSNYKIYQKTKSRRKRGPRPSQVRNGSTQKKVNYQDQKSKGSSSGIKSKGPKYKKVDETSISKANENKVEETLPCFVIEFAPGIPLPSKEDVLKLFGKFGSLSRKDVKVVLESHSIQMVFSKDSDAEAAFKSAMSECPFGSEKVTCRLLHHSPSPPVKHASDTQDDDDMISEAHAIKHKADIMTATLENNRSKFSSEERANLKEEMICIAEKIEAFSNKVQAMAENTSSS